MREDDQALIMNTGVMPTTSNYILAIGGEMAEAFRNKHLESLNSGFAASLTAVQRRMIERHHESVAA